MAMKQPSFQQLMITLFVFAAAIYAVSQSLTIGGDIATKIATQLSDCPTVTSGYRLCPVVPATGQPFLAISVAGWNNGAPFIPTPPASTFTASATALPAGSSPTVSVSGSAFTFGIPAGATGPQGIPGPVQSFNTNKCSSWSGGNSGVTETGCAQSNP